MNRSEYETLMMAHDNLQRELSDIKRLMGKDKHALIKSNIALNRKVKELERELEETKLDESTIETYKRISRLAVTGEKIAKKENKRYREALEEIIHLEQLKETNVFGYDHEDITSYVETVARKALEGEN